MNRRTFVKMGLFSAAAAAAGLDVGVAVGLCEPPDIYRAPAKPLSIDDANNKLADDGESIDLQWIRVEWPNGTNPLKTARGECRYRHCGSTEWITKMVKPDRIQDGHIVYSITDRIECGFLLDAETLAIIAAD